RPSPSIRSHLSSCPPTQNPVSPAGAGGTAWDARTGSHERVVEWTPERFALAFQAHPVCALTKRKSRWPFCWRKLLAETMGGYGSGRRGGGPTVESELSDRH